MGLLLLMGNSFSGALDALGTGLESAWSVGRRLRAAYSGPVIRVRRSSDNAEQDFSGSGASGAVSVSAVTAFCGAGDGFITTIYGQSGLSRNLTQSTTTLQPVCVSSGVAVTQNGYLACSTTTAAARRMTVGSSTSTYNFLHTTGGTMYVVHQSTDTAARKGLIGTSSNIANSVPGFILLSDASERIEVRTGRLDVASVATTGNSISLVTTDTGATSARLNSIYVDPDNGTAGSRCLVWQNTTQSATANASTGTPFVENAASDLTLLAYGGGTSPYDGTFCELVIWSGDRTANRTTWEDNAKTFWGTP